jgi:rubrerythrin
MKERATTTRKTKSGIAVERLLNELARVASMEEKVAAKVAETSFIAISDESIKRKLYQILRESRDHSSMLVSNVDGLDRLKDSYKERFVQIPPFLLGGKTEVETMENQLRAVKSLKIVYEGILQLLDELGDKTEIKEEGVETISGEIKSLIKDILAAKKKQIATTKKLSVCLEKHAS